LRAGTGRAKLRAGAYTAVVRAGRRDASAKLASVRPALAAAEPAAPAPKKQAKEPRQGIHFWMRRVLAECRHVQRSVATSAGSPVVDEDAVHSLRVALRRCRTMAEAMRALDPHPAWRRMRKAARRLFQRLGELRDTQVLSGWVRRLEPHGDPVALTLLGILSERERLARQSALRALERFDRREWKRLRAMLASRARRVPPDSLAFELLALERWQSAVALHRTALRSRTPASYHRLRIGLKKFRYVVENYLPARHAGWGADLKQLQDVLGEAHDLDVLWLTLPETGDVFDDTARARWHSAVQKEMEARLAAYREKTIGESSLWNAWRAALPQGTRLERAAEARLAAWAGFLGADLRHGRRVARLTIQLYDGLRAAEISPGLPDASARRILRAAALLHDVGRTEGDRAHHKSSYRLIRALEPPPGWSVSEMELAAQVARYHRGAEPRLTHKAFAALSTVEQEAVRWLAGVVRLANALDARPESRAGAQSGSAVGAHAGSIGRLEVNSTPDGIVIYLKPSAPRSARGRGAPLSPQNGGATLTPPEELLVERKRLLESTLGRPVYVRPAQEFAS